MSNRQDLKNSGELLNIAKHDRDNAALTYVYPVVSRRAGGVSIGINLNPNNACNWRCIYCQVPNLVRGTAPPTDLVLLENELRGFLDEIFNGNFMINRVPDGAQRLNDIALSGNGEPTSAVEFTKVIDLLARVRHDFAQLNTVKTVLITNGSLLYRNTGQSGLLDLAKLNGEIWFKFDRASSEGMQQVNDIRMNISKVRENLVAAISCCPTWLQTCWFALDSSPPSIKEEEDYLEFVSELLSDGHKLQGVLLYSLARPSLQTEAPRLTSLSQKQLQDFADRISKLGLKVKVTP